MSIRLIIDYFNIDKQDALIVSNNKKAVNINRKKIDTHLEQKIDTLLRVRLNTPALFRHFSDYEGLNRVLLTQKLLPREILKNLSKKKLPDWLSNELIVRLKILDNKQFLEPLEASATIQFEKYLLKNCNNDLLSNDIEVFFSALSKQTPTFLHILTIDAVQDCFKTHLILGLSLNNEVADLLIKALLTENSMDSFLSNLTYQQHLLSLRCFIDDYQLNLTLPAKNLSDLLLNALPTFPFVEKEASSLPDKFIEALQLFERKILNEEVQSKNLCPILVDWPSLLTELSELIEENKALMSDELLLKLSQFNSQESQSLLKNLQNRCQKYPLLEANASVDETLHWSEDYFDYCRTLFLNKELPDEVINLSFSEWLIHQSVRVARSPNNWRYCATQIEAYLKEAYIVVVIMIDALSALNKDIILAELAELNHLNLQQDDLFAPLPTLTEVGKMAVLTGLETDKQQGKTQTEILQNCYQRYLVRDNSLKVVKSWKDSSERLDENTQLVVLFENRLDERLHDCVSFSKHRDDIKPIIKQINRSIEKWRKDAAQFNKDIAFFITADHGMTVTSEYYQGKALGEIKERVFKKVASNPNHPDFEVMKGYAIPKKRLRLSKEALLTHGGLTPEEVMIPFIRLTSNTPQLIKTPLSIILTSINCIKLPDEIWQVECCLSSNIDVKNIQLTLTSPFKGKETIDSLRAGKSQRVQLKFSAHPQQEGAVELPLHLSYDRNDGGHEENEKLLNIEFPPILLEKNTDTENFEGMF
ncbi:MAG: PglZ domain-containing protein [Methylococcales bacterium]|nr:PglZ domain-containing protein [Methylococcales bacterium]